jgi:hypothetical protein
MGYDLTVRKVAVITVLGSIVRLLMIPLRQALIVKEHGRSCSRHRLPVLVAGEKGERRPAAISGVRPRLHFKFS